MTFQLHGRLAADTLYIGDYDLCTVRLMNTNNIPWLILVPQQEGIVEVSDLSASDQQQLWVEVMQTHEALREMTSADKMNLGALGNLVPQLHFHVMARFKTDPAWPGPVWGNIEVIPYGEGEAQKLLQQLREKLNLQQVAA